MLVGNVSATSYITSYYTVTNKCAVIKDNKAVVPVTVKANSDDLKISKLMKEHRIDYIDNRDALKLRIYDISNEKLDVYVDYLKNDEDESFIIFTVPEDMELDRHDTLVSFNIEVEILAKINKMNVLGNEVVLGDEKTCEDINGFKIDEVETVKYVDLSKVDHSEYFEDLFTGVIVGLLSVSLIICLVILFRLKKNIKSLKK